MRHVELFLDTHITIAASPAVGSDVVKGAIALLGDYDARFTEAMVVNAFGPVRDNELRAVFHRYNDLTTAIHPAGLTEYEHFVLFAVGWVVDRVRDYLAAEGLRHFSISTPTAVVLGPVEAATATATPNTDDETAADLSLLMCTVTGPDLAVASLLADSCCRCAVEQHGAAVPHWFDSFTEYEVVAMSYDQLLTIDRDFVGL